MQYTVKQLSRQLIAPVVASLILVSCAQIRQLTYPSNFVYLDKSDVTTVMQSMAQGITRINRSIVAGTTTNDQVDAILHELDYLELQAESLIGKRRAADNTQLLSLSTNHLLIDEHLDEFLENIGRAKIQAQDEPPNLYAVGQLTGACNACHRLR